MNKYGAKKETVDGYQFDSRKEARRYVSLKILQMAGEIAELKVHPVYLLQGAFTYRGRRIRKIEYVADFQYIEDGQIITEDVKGNRSIITALAKVKIKMFKYKYPELVFRVEA